LSSRAIGEGPAFDRFDSGRWQWDIYRKVEKLDPIRAAWYFAHYAAIAVAKRS
jgi:hypothetical protein